MEFLTLSGIIWTVSQYFHIIHNNYAKNQYEEKKICVNRSMYNVYDLLLLLRAKKFLYEVLHMIHFKNTSWVVKYIRGQTFSTKYSLEYKY